MTKLYSPGDKSRAICPHCAKLVTTTFVYATVPFDDGNGSVKDILVAQCDECRAVVAIPAQSTPAIRHARETANVSLEAVLPAPYVEILDAAAFRIDNQATPQFRKTLFAFYLPDIPRTKGEADQFRQHLQKWGEEHDGRFNRIGTAKVPNKRISLKLSKRTGEEVDEIVARTGLTKTNLVRGIIMLVERDLILGTAEKPLKQLQRLAAIVNA